MYRNDQGRHKNTCFTCLFGLFFFICLITAVVRVFSGEPAIDIGWLFPDIRAIFGTIARILD